MKHKRTNAIYTISLLLCSIFAFQAKAQRTLIDVSIDSVAILIGEQTTLHYTLTVDKNQEVRVIIPPDTLMAGVEILSVSKPDTSMIENERMLIKQDLLITSFDSALYLLPPIKVVDGQDTIASASLALKVSTIPVNADQPEEFNDIKNIWTPPFVLADYYPLIFGILLAIILLCLAAYIIKRLRNKQSLVPFVKAEPPLPPHEQAVKELNSIKERKLWQNGFNKEYYTLTTETLRNYIERRYEINAMEMTSIEILEILKSEESVNPVYRNLKQMLELADYVKFAKMHPLPDENEQMMTQAYHFIEETKKVLEVVEKVTSGEEKSNEKITENKLEK